MSAQNVSNIATAGYKQRLSFSRLIEATEQSPQAGGLSVRPDFAQGKLLDTGNPYDLAIAGPGFFAVRSGEQILYTRNGQFSRDSDGRLVTGGGLVLQADGGGDLVLKGRAPQILGDGVFIEDDQPVAKLAILDIADPSLLTYGEAGTFAADASAMETVSAPSVRQGMLEASNVSTGDQMVTTMAALRSAETAQRLMTVYDDLMGRALSVFGQA